MDSILLVRDIPIPCHSHIPDYRPYINDYNFYVEQLMEIVTALSTLHESQHFCFSNTNSRDNCYHNYVSRTIVLQRQK